jgi:hypothetical protein
MVKTPPGLTIVEAVETLIQIVVCGLFMSLTVV